VVNLETNAGWRYIADIRRWVCECHLNSVIHQRLGVLNREQLIDHMTGTKSFRPMRIAEQFLSFPDNDFWVRNRIRQILMANSFILHAFGTEQLDKMVGFIVDRQFMFEFGKRLEQTAFWKENKPRVRTEFNKMKKVQQVMGV
jgi:hypothetical protein